MAIPVITNITLPTNREETLANIKAAIRNAFTSMGFPASNFDTYSVTQPINVSFTDYHTYSVMEYIWNPDNPNGRIYIRLAVTDRNNSAANPMRIGVDLFRTWNTSTKSGTGQSSYLNLNTGVVNDNTYGFNATNLIPAKITAINHPEARGLLFYQGINYASTFFLQPANMQAGFGLENFPWFLMTGNFLNAYTTAGVGQNPFNDTGTYAMESWSSLRNRFRKPDGSEIFQILPAPKIISPTNQGFMGWFSNDLGLCNSNMLPVESRIRVGLKEHMLIHNKVPSGITIALN